jgi:hypothetical protein
MGDERETPELKEGLADVMIRTLSDMVGPEEATRMTRSAFEHAEACKTLREELEFRVRGPRQECVAAIEARFGTLDERTREVIECLGPYSLHLATRMTAGCATRSDLGKALRLVERVVGEGTLRGARQVLRGILERRFGVLDERSYLAIELADDIALNICFERLKGAASATDVVEHLLERERRID